MAVHGYAWQYMAVQWQYMAIHSYTRLYMAIHGIASLYMAGCTWLNMAICYQSRLYLYKYDAALLKRSFTFVSHFMLKKVIVF